MSTVPPRVRDAFNEWARERRQLLTPHWEHPACVKCAGCGQPLELTWSSSAVGQKLIHGRCWPEWKRNQRKETK